MALNRSASLLSKSFSQLSGKTFRRRKINSPAGQYSVLEPRKLLAAIAWSGSDITQDRDVSVNGSLVFALNGSESTGGDDNG